MTPSIPGNKAGVIVTRIKDWWPARRTRLRMIRGTMSRIWILPLLAASPCGHSVGEGVSAQRQSALPAEMARLRDDGDGRDWPGYGRTFGEQHYSPLNEINADNVSRLALAWFMDLGTGNPVTVPVAVDGVLYFASGHSIVHAVDAATGKLLWIYDSKAGELAGRRMRISWGSRGIAYWNGKVYTGTTDGRLIAIDAHSGKPVWSAVTVGKDDGRYITGAPRVFDGRIIIGHGGADNTSTRGYVTTYDAETGKQLWRFFIVPGNPADGFEDEAQKMAASTWGGQWWKNSGGGHAWNAFTYDPDTDTVFVGTGNGAPWNHRVRSAGKGDNLFLSSIVALNAKTGAYKWHYQVNPGDSWDYDAAMDMQIADLTINGMPRKVIIQAPKNGFLYVIDRTNGKLISAEKIAKVTWATKIDIATGRPAETRDARFPKGQDFELWPSTSGAHNWMPSAYSPRSGLLYVPLMESGVVINDRKYSAANWKRDPGNAFDEAFDMAGGIKDPLQDTGWLLAIDPATQQVKWKFQNPTLRNGGLMATGGDLVFQGLGAAETFNAYAAQSGKRLWSFATQAPVFSAPITYLAHGKQYVSILVGSGTVSGFFPLPGKNDAGSQRRRVLSFALGGKSVLPPQNIVEFRASADPEYRPDAALAQHGAEIYARGCMACHGGAAVSGGTAPDLRASSVPQSEAAFDRVVRGGALTAGGMPQFDEFSGTETAALRQYIRSRADDERNGR
jgi:quinohemoprotein ethanol dehydrogenase